MPSTVATPCPNSTETGCRCWEHDLGLSRYCPSQLAEAYEAILAPLRKKPTALCVLDLDDKPACNGSMTCDCESCAKDRASRVAVGAGPAQFKPRPARRAA